MRAKLFAARGEIALSVLKLIRSGMKRLALLDLYHHLLVRLIRRQRLFDAAFYSLTYSDQIDGDPLWHYVVEGDRAGYTGLPMFDPGFYKTHAGRRAGRINTLLHFCWVGQYRRISPGPWFDIEYYLNNNLDVLHSGINPLFHYWNWGGREGRRPCQQFDSAVYLLDNPDVAAAGVNPLYHYLSFGREEGRRLNLEPLSPESARPPLQTGGEIDRWHGLRPRTGVADALLDVVIPVYKGEQETLDCIHSVLVSACDIPFELIVINDHSPEPELGDKLTALADFGLFLLLDNETNMGFVRTINRGIAIHPQRDVLLLNSDTAVYPGWLDRLSAAAYRHERTGTVCPLSNNASICSYPYANYDNHNALELPFAELDRIAARVNSGEEVETPTVVGFCMYVRRDCLNEVGIFDAESFGHGYGEENDFCQRAIDKGWRNIVAVDCYVRHLGSLSFQGSRQKRVDDALRTLTQRFPAYRAQILNFMKIDPLRKYRRRIDWARLEADGERNNVLLIGQPQGAESAFWLEEEIRHYRERGFAAFRLLPRGKSGLSASLQGKNARLLPNLPAISLSASDELTAAVRTLHVREINILSLRGFAPESFACLLAAAREAQVRLLVTINDYLPICPGGRLLDAARRYCGEPDEIECNHCIRTRNLSCVDISTWRQAYMHLLHAAAEVRVPDPDVGARISRYFPHAPVTLVRRDLPLLRSRTASPARDSDIPFRVLVIGEIEHSNASDGLLGCARDAQTRDLPLRFVYWGQLSDARELESEGVEMAGPLRFRVASRQIARLSVDCVWIPHTYPDIDCFPLLLALGQELPVFGFDIGSTSHRLSELGMVDALIPLEWAGMHSKINDFIIGGLLARRAAHPSPPTTSDTRMTVESGCKPTMERRSAP